MNKQQLVNEVAIKCNMTKKASDEAVTAVFATIEEALAKQDKVSLVGFGVFEVRERAQRNGLNPQTKEPMIIPATKTPGFKAGKNLKDIVKFGKDAVVE